jgi:thioredoxin
MNKLLTLLTSCLFALSIEAQQTTQHNNNESHYAKYMTTADFQLKVFDYKVDPTTWKYKGTRPCVIDFYTTWCGPCKMLAPVIESLAKEYKGKVDFYKIDTEKEPELAALFGIRSIPTLLFIPTDGLPQMAQGALPREILIKAMTEIFKLEK